MNQAMPSWIAKYIAEQRTLYGDMVPPWAFLPDTHPYSIGWRMGSGESHIDAWSHWWHEQAFNLEERFAYFRKWPPPPRWLAWMVCAVWELEPWEEEDFDYAPYFAELERRDFGTYAEYERDLDDPRWLEKTEDAEQ